MQMKDTGVHRIVQNCPKLKSLALANCPTITDTSMGEVATYCSHIRFVCYCGINYIVVTFYLKVFFFQHVMVAILWKYFTFRSLDVSGCKNVGNNGLRMLAMACQQLEFLDISSTASTHKAYVVFEIFCRIAVIIVVIVVFKRIWWLDLYLRYLVFNTYARSICIPGRCILNCSNGNHLL